MKNMSIIDTEMEAMRMWYSYIVPQGLPEGIPLHPDKVYVDEWKGWAHWVGWVTAEMN